MKKIFTLSLMGLLLSLPVFAESNDKDAELKELNATAKEIASKRAKINSSIDLSAFMGDEKDVKLDEKTLKYLDNFLDCKADKTEIDVPTGDKATQEIIGFDGDKCIVHTTIKDKTVKCAFPKDKLSEVTKYYKDTMSNGFGGKYYFNLDMKMPEINFKDFSDDNLDFGIKLEMPKIKIDKVQSEIEKLVKDSCSNE
ncbi:MAG: hypothetical protein IJ638_04355 [Alphaproteobacteria bacterium]|nr:hypothetical protein [Alphaproteobacteria bacterium]